jgi:hypothetical protein
VRQIVQAQAGWFSPFSRVLEFYQPGVDPPATMGFDRCRRQTVMAQSDKRAVAIRL